ncbi:hypothetical protein [Leptospira sp. GIMC2001]|uniref:hypothetical protein n=1 Tax=Leptospira sp. GIMC2001 TaxID=1513297 RepID=UPI0023497C91|nr:hypothetical protein [Leptospira sp. GIMC2001]WCL47981.1 hypothetical protein O4O04_11695 [Leptospira sp. GIMC2001]
MIEWTWIDLKNNLKLMIFPSLFGFLFFLNVWQSTEYNRIKREIQKVISAKESLTKKNEELKISILTESSSEKVDRIFERNYREVQPGEKWKIQTLILPSNKELKK